MRAPGSPRRLYRQTRAAGRLFADVTTRECRRARPSDTAQRHGPLAHLPPTTPASLSRALAGRPNMPCGHTGSALRPHRVARATFSRMINGFHALIYSDDPPATRAFLRDILG